MALFTDEEMVVEPEVPLLKHVVVHYPTLERGMDTLKELLEMIQLKSLLTIPWSSTCPSYLQDFGDEAYIREEFVGSARADP